MSEHRVALFPQLALMTAFVVAMALAAAIDARTKNRLRFGAKPPAKRIELDEGGAANIALATGENGAELIDDVLGPRTPPLVVVAVAIASQKSVDNALLDAAPEMLPDDRSDARALLSPAS